jgi:hypothetical protein
LGQTILSGSEIALLRSEMELSASISDIQQANWDLLYGTKTLDFGGFSDT